MKERHSIAQVLIVGGTHGNEWTGAYLVQKWQQHPEFVRRSTFETTVFLSNPMAFSLNKRYVERDLNRCFHVADLNNPALSSYEDQLAKTIAQTFGQSGKTPVDWVMDLHSTTANMGQTLIVDQHPFNLRLAAHLASQNPDVRVYQSSVVQRGLRTLCPLNCTIEVGAVAQSTLHADRFQQTEALTYAILDYLDRYNQGEDLLTQSLTVYRHLRSIDYPRNQAGEIQAMIHPKLQFQDYQPLHPGDPIFLTFDQETIPYQGEAVVYPVFINEAAYYEQGVAFHLTEKQEISIE